MEKQRILAIAILFFFIPYLIVHGLTYEGHLNEKNFAPPLLRYFPKFIKRRASYIKKTTKLDGVRPTFIDKFNLFSRYPLTPPKVHSFLDSVRPRFWLVTFSILGKIMFVASLFLLALLAINLEGVLGYPLLVEGWAEWFTKYDYDVTKIKLLK
jgi:hypothetical protein